MGGTVSLLLGDSWDSFKGRNEPAVDNTRCMRLHSSSFAEQTITPSPMRPHGAVSPGAQVPLTQKWVYNVGRPTRIPYPSGTVTGPEGACDPSRPWPFQIAESYQSFFSF